MILKYQQFILNSTKHKQVLIKIKINKKIENSSATLTLLRWYNKLKSTFAMSSSCYSISKLLYRSIFFYTLFTSSPMSSNFTLTYQRNEKQQLVKFYTMHCSCIALNVFFGSKHYCGCTQGRIFISFYYCNSSSIMLLVQCYSNIFSNNSIQLKRLKGVRQK